MLTEINKQTISNETELRKAERLLIEHVSEYFLFEGNARCNRYSLECIDMFSNAIQEYKNNNN